MFALLITCFISNPSCRNSPSTGPWRLPLHEQRHSRSVYPSPLCLVSRYESCPSLGRTNISHRRQLRLTQKRTSWECRRSRLRSPCLDSESQARLSTKSSPSECCSRLERRGPPPWKKADWDVDLAICKMQIGQQREDLKQPYIEDRCLGSEDFFGKISARQWHFWLRKMIILLRGIDQWEKRRWTGWSASIIFLWNLFVCLRYKPSSLRLKY